MFYPLGKSQKNLALAPPPPPRPLDVRGLIEFEIRGAIRIVIEFGIRFGIIIGGVIVIRIEIVIGVRIEIVSENKNWNQNRIRQCAQCHPRTFITSQTTRL